MAKMITRIVFLSVCVQLTLSGSIFEPEDINAIQEKLIQHLNPQPILDKIQEGADLKNNVHHEVGKALVSVYEQFSSAATNAFHYPKQKILDLGSGVTKFLDQIGGKLVGLSKK